MRFISISERPFPSTGVPLLLCCVLAAFCAVERADAQSADAPSTRVLLDQAKHLEATQRYPDAIALYREILLREPENDDIRATLARLLSWQGVYAEAVDLYRDIVRRHPVDLDTRTALARVLSWQKHRTEAQQLYEGVLQENPRHVDALQGLADLLYWEGHSEKALRYYEQAYAVSNDAALAQRIASIKSALTQPENRLPASVHPPRSGEREQSVARTRALTTEHGPASTAYQLLLTEYPEDDEIRGELARALAKEGQLEQAVLLYRDILTRHPADVDVRIGLARVLSWQKQYDAAILLYQEILRQSDTNREALQGLADSLFWRGATQDALVQYSRLYQLTGDEAIATRIKTVAAALEASPQAPVGLRDSIVRLPYRDYLKLGYGQFSYSHGIPGERDILIEASKSIGAQTVIARVEPINRFGFHDTPVSAELYSPLWRRAWGYVAAQGAMNPQFSPNYSIAGELSQGLGIAHPLLSMFEVSFGYRRLSYKTDDIDLLMPGITVFLPFNVWITEKLYYVPDTGAMTLASRVTWRPTNRLQLFASGSFGTSGERIVATQDVARVSSRAFQGGITLPITERISLEATGYYEDRGTLYVRRGGSFSIIYHW